MNKAVKRERAPLFEKTIKPPEDTSDITTVDGKHGYWRTISNIRVFLPIGGEWKDVKEHIGGILNERWEKNNAVREERQKKFKEDRDKNTKKLESGSVANIVNDKTASKDVVMSLPNGDKVSFKGHNGTVSIDKGILKRITNGKLAEKDSKAKDLTDYNKAYINQSVENGKTAVKCVNAVAEAWNKLPQEYRNDVDVFEIRTSIKGGENGGVFRPTETKEYKNKVEIGYSENIPFVRGVVRHEMAHARWHKIPKNVRNEMIEKIIKSGNLGHTAYAASWKAVWDKQEKKLERLKKHGSKRSFITEADRKKDEVDRIDRMEKYVDWCRDHWVNEIHSEYFAVKEYPNHLDAMKDPIDIKQFEEIGKIFESVMGKDYMEKAMVLDDMVYKYNREDHGDKLIISDEIIYYLDKNMLMTQFRTKAKFQSVYGLDGSGKLLLHAILPYGENDNNIK